MRFTSCTKIYFYFSLKMQKLCEDSTYEYSETQFKSTPEEIHPQHDCVTENTMDWIIFDLNDKFTNAPCEGSGWTLHSLTECVAAFQKYMIPLNNTKVGTQCLLPRGLCRCTHIKNLQPRYILRNILKKKYLNV